METIIIRLQSSFDNTNVSVLGALCYFLFVIMYDKINFNLLSCFDNLINYLPFSEKYKDSFK